MGRFRKPDFKAEVTRSDVGLTETALFCHPDKIIPGIGRLEQNMPECPPGHPGIEPAASAPLHILIDFIAPSTNSAMGKFSSAWSRSVV